MSASRRARCIRRERGGRAQSVTGVVEEHVLQLQPHEQEDGPLEHQLDRAPVQLVGQALFRREAAGGPLTGDDAGHDGGDQARTAELLGGEVGEERDREPDRGVRRRVRDERPHAQVHPPDEAADDDRDDHAPEEGQRELPEVEGADADRGDRGAQEHQRGGVVEQALAFQQRHDAS